MSTATTASGRSTPSTAGNKPPEIEGWLNTHIYHPLSNRLAAMLQHTFITPNMVSVMGGLAICAAAWAYTTLAWPVSVAIGFLLHISWHVIDGADGQLARLTGKASATGELVDGVCDYTGHIILYVVMALVLQDWIGGWAWAAAVGAGISHILQANHSESQRRIYRWWAYGTTWLGQADKDGGEMFGPRTVFTMLFGWIAKGYVWLSRQMNPDSAEVDAAFAEASGNPVLIERMRKVVRQEAKTALLYQHMVGPNPRAIMLGISMALGSPLWFFLAEIVENLVLIISVREHRRMNRRLAVRLRAELAAA